MPMLNAVCHWVRRPEAEIDPHSITRIHVSRGILNPTMRCQTGVE